MKVIPPILLAYVAGLKAHDVAKIVSTVADDRRFVTPTATVKRETIPEQFFFYRVGDELIVEIRPEPIVGGAPQGILQQIGATWPPS